MGWWKIKNVETGQIDFDQSPTDEKILYNGDGPADIMGPALDTIADMYREAWGRDPKLDELQAVFNFVTGADARESGIFKGGDRFRVMCVPKTINGGKARKPPMAPGTYWDGDRYVAPDDPEWNPSKLEELKKGSSS